MGTRWNSADDMPDKLTPVDQVIERARQDGVLAHPRFRPCPVCGQAYDHADALLAAHHSTEEHEPLRD